ESGLPRALNERFLLLGFRVTAQVSKVERRWKKGRELGERCPALPPEKPPMTETLSLNREEIRAVYDAGPEAVIALVKGLLTRHQAMEAANQQLEARVKALEDRLSKDSHNSGKP